MKRDQTKDRRITQNRNRFKLPWEIGLVIILLLGAYFRLVGVKWDGNYHLHPDERFLTMVETSLSPVHSISEYFNTDQSGLNPQNRGYSFFVYGTLPIFLVRYLAQWTQQIGYDQVNVLGRICSAFFDLGTVLLVYLTGWKLFGKKVIGLLAAAFYAFSVLPIQLSHYFTVDTSTNFFGMLSICLLAILIKDYILVPRLPGVQSTGLAASPEFNFDRASYPIFTRSTAGFFVLSGLFGLAIGMTAASKINGIVLAVLLPVAIILGYYLGAANKEDKAYWARSLVGIAIAAILAILSFRVFQPYAFKGPGFFNINLNQNWLASLKELQALSSSTTGFPPSVQWANRPLWFAWQNMVEWGMGLPLGVLAWVGLFGLFFLRKKEHRLGFFVLSIWTIGYFLWQELAYTRSMRYQMLVYPTLAIMASLFLYTLWERGKSFIEKNKARIGKILVILAWVTGIGVLVATLAWAFAFTRIYTRPVTRIEASYWIYQNVPGPINLKIQTDDTTVNQPVEYTLGTSIKSDQPVELRYSASVTGTLTGMDLSYVRDQNYLPTSKTLEVQVVNEDDQGQTTSTAVFNATFDTPDDPRGKSYSLVFDVPLSVQQGQDYLFTFSVIEPDQELRFFGPLTIDLQGNEGAVAVSLPEPVNLLRKGDVYSVNFQAHTSGDLTGIQIDHIVDWQGLPVDKRLLLSIKTPRVGGDQLLGSVMANSTFLANTDKRGDSLDLQFKNPIHLDQGVYYTLEIRFLSGSGEIAIYGSRQANESSWDDPLPYAVYGPNAFDYYNGVYRTDLNFEVYWDDNAEKLNRYETDLDQADYIFISSNRQWGSVTRLPDYYPLTTLFYRDLLGCPEGKEIKWCYSVAEPGMFKGKLGFELVKTFTSYPNLGPFAINTQLAEEAFTVYDNPKILIFKKTSTYDPAVVEKELGSVDLANVPSISNFSSHAQTGDLMLPSDRLAQQQAGGTWSQLFDTNSLLNRYPILGLIVWYLLISGLGWMVFPTVRIVFRGMKDHGYPFSRLAGLLLLAFFVWLAGSYQIPFIKLTIVFILVGLFLVNFILVILQWKELVADLKENYKYYLGVELVSLVFFTYFLLIRLGNPDLWHPYKGGEKPMDFSYFNAVLKSTSFPPYDPWYAGGYINYYYYGYVVVGVPVKLLGIVPSVAYNLILPTLFSFVALAAYCIGWNAAIFLGARAGQEWRLPQSSTGRARLRIKLPAWTVGIVCVIIVLILGNLGTVRMIWDGFQKLASNGATVEQAGFLQRWEWTFQGIAKFLTGEKLPYAAGDWYWIPSRTIPGEAITEFPAFTFLYADLHAHMMALPVTITAIGLAFALVLRKWKWGLRTEKSKWLGLLVTMFVGGVIIGALRPMNTWDVYTYLPLAMVAIAYAGFRYADRRWTVFGKTFSKGGKILAVVLVELLLVVFTMFLYKPFSQWYMQGYNSIEFWQGSRTPFWSFLTHFGLFLFIILSWLIVEWKDWLANTPVSFLQKLRPYREILWLGLALITSIIIILSFLGIQIAWLVVPMIVLAAMLIFLPGQNEIKRFFLFLLVTALSLCLVVELVVLKGDLGRMNTVFKIYMQVWSLLAISSGVALCILIPRMFARVRSTLKVIWQIMLVLLAFGAALFTITATIDKIRDRMSAEAPHTLDGMTYMLTSTYWENGLTMDLSQDYYAIRWMQENVIGSPVIVEGNVPEYRWGTRYTIYTGLPGVVGWNWHQRQQRGVVSADAVQQRVDQVGQFFNTTDRTFVENFINQYNVKYIIVGQMEQAIYSQEGLNKFITWNGDLWQVVYLHESTTIYQVIR
jgi:YYY domain-containing protein